MLSVAKVGGGRANYYTGLAAEDYYVGERFSHEPEGVWMGTGAERTQLDGKRVRAEEFKRLFDGFSPDGKEKWVHNAGKYEGKKNDRMPGYDFTFSAPKSVSICWAIGTEETREAIGTAHGKAVEKAIEEIEKKAIIRSGAGGKNRESAGLIVAAFQHATARQVNAKTLPDMQLHTHAVAINTGISEKRRRGALNGLDFLNRDFAKQYGAVYRAELGKELRRLGFELAQTKDGFEIKGVSEGLVQEFSKRRGQIEKETTEESTAKEKLRANHKTRQAKHEFDPKEVLAHWITTAERKYHFTEDSIEKLRGHFRGQPGKKQKESKEEALTPEERIHTVRLVAKELVEEKTAFTRRELQDRVRDAFTVKGVGADEVKDSVESWMKWEAVKVRQQEREVEWKTKGGTTLKLISENLYTVKTAEAAAEKEIARQAEREEKRTAAFAGMREELGRRGHRVMACTWSKASAAEMEKRTGIQTVTVSQLLSDARAEVFELEREKKTDVGRRLYAEYKHATWQWGSKSKQKYLGEYYKPTSRFKHEFLYATHQISRRHRDYLNRELKHEKEAEERAGRKIENGTVVLLDASSKGLESKEVLQRLKAEIEKRGGEVVFSDALEPRLAAMKREGTQGNASSAREESRRQNEEREQEQQQQRQQQRRR